jgi:hypothetical protein
VSLFVVKNKAWKYSFFARRGGDGTGTGTELEPMTPFVKSRNVLLNCCMRVDVK